VWLSLIALALTGIVWVGDLATGADVAFTLLYLAPIGFGVWCVGLPLGISLSVASALGSFVLRAAASPDASSLTLLWNTLAELAIFVVFSATVDAFRKRLDAQTELAFSDPLTGLGNVRALQEALEDACEQGAPLTMLYLDVDDFERVNDERGRVVGDRLLQRVAAAVRAELREGDVAVRLGGDELGVVMPATDYAQASQVLARLRSLRPSLHDEPLGVTLSLGAVTFLRPPTDPRRVVAMADRAMYSSKRAGGATVTHELVSAAFVTAPMDPSAAE
jgi:diguanylate cyclase (GGDEF)-like protein